MQQNTNIVRLFLDEKNWSLWMFVYFLSTIIPFLCTILFIRKHNFCWVSLAIQFSCLFFLVLITVLFTKKFRNLTAKLFFPLLSVLILISFYKSYSGQLYIADLYFYKTRVERLENLVKEINDYQKINQMNDGLRTNATINGSGGANSYNAFMEKLEKKNIDKEKYFWFAGELRNMDLSEFEKKEDGSIYFKIEDGVLGAYGVAYFPDGIKSEGNPYGYKIRKHLGGKWYMFST